MRKKAETYRDFRSRVTLQMDLIPDQLWYDACGATGIPDSMSVDEVCQSYPTLRPQITAILLILSGHGAEEDD